MQEMVHYFRYLDIRSIYLMCNVTGTQHTCAIGGIDSCIMSLRVSALSFVVPNFDLKACV